MRPRRRRMKKGCLRSMRKNRKIIEWYSNHIRDMCCNYAFMPDDSDDGERVLSIIFSDGMDESKYTIEGASIIEALDNAAAKNEPTLHMLANAYSKYIEEHVRVHSIENIEED